MIWLTQYSMILSGGQLNSILCENPYQHYESIVYRIVCK